MYKPGQYNNRQAHTHTHTIKCSWFYTKLLFHYRSPVSLLLKMVDPPNFLLRSPWQQTSSKLFNLQTVINSAILFVTPNIL